MDIRRTATDEYNGASSHQIMLRALSDPVLNDTEGPPYSQTNSIRLDIFLQILVWVSSALVVVLFIMVGLSLYRKRSDRDHDLSSGLSQDPVTKVGRKSCMQKTLLVKHVILEKEARTSEASNDSTHNSERHAQGEVESIAISVRHKILWRKKSDLRVSDVNNPDAMQDSTREPWILCAICLIPYEVGDEICWSRNPECNHAFHRNCISHWLENQDECPMCRCTYWSPSDFAHESGDLDVDEQV